MFFVEIKAKYFLLEPKCGAWRQNGGRLGDVTEAGRPFLRGLEVILQILRFGDHFCGDHGASAPPPSKGLVWFEVKLTLVHSGLPVGFAVVMNGTRECQG